ncbi:MAG: DUF378 domain-containing protein [Clostridia bacterium]|nr:DUF378 domain-containing protein [Clostridia bacterium]
MIIANIISYVLVLVGAVNWGLYGIFNFNLVSWVFQGPRTVGAIITYVIITLCAVWLIISPIISGHGLRLSMREEQTSESAHRPERSELSH